MWVQVVFVCVVMSNPVFKLDKLIDKGKYEEAISYANSEISPSVRSSGVWEKIGFANEKLGYKERALACYSFAVAKNSKKPSLFIAIARINNKLNNPKEAIRNAKKAMKIEDSVDAMWQYAVGTKKLGRIKDAKLILERIIEKEPDNINASIELGKIYLNEGKYEKAIGQFEKCEGISSDKIAVLVGSAYKKLGDYKTAESYYQKALTGGGIKDTDAEIDYAIVNYRLGKYKKAIGCFNSAVSKKECSAKVFYVRALCYEKIGKKKNAYKDYVKAINKKVGLSQRQILNARVKIGKNDLKNKKYSKALKQFLIVEKAEDYVVDNFHYSLAKAYVGTNNVDKAISVLEQAVAFNTKDVTSYILLASLYTKKGMKNKAKYAYERIKTLTPNNPKVYISLADYEMSVKNYDNALGYYSKSNEIKKSKTALVGIALCASKTGKVEMAIEASEAALKINPNLWNMIEILANSYIAMANYKKAEPNLEKLVKKYPNKNGYNKMLAICYQNNNKLEKLRLLDRKLVAKDKYNIDSRMRIANTALENNDIKTALKYFEELCVLLPNNHRVLSKVYHIYKNEGNIKKAIYYMEKYLVLKPKETEVLVELADLYYLQKNYDKAFALYSRAVKSNKNVKGIYKNYIDAAIRVGTEKEIVSILSNAVKLNEASVEDCIRLAGIYGKNGEYVKAVKMYRRASDMSPKDYNILLSVATYQTKINDINGAILSYEQALMINPHLVNEYKMLGDLYSKLGKKDVAIKLYSKYLDNGGENNKIAKKVGLDLFNRKKYLLALKYLSKVKGKEANGPKHLLLYGRACFEAGNFSSAIEILEKFRKKYPNNNLKAVLYSLGKSYEMEMDEPKAALVYAEYIRLKGVKNKDIAYKAAFFQEKINPIDAKRIYLSNIRQYPNDYRNFYRLGILYSKNHNSLSKALFTLKRASELTNKVPDAWLLMGRICGKLGKENNQLLAYSKYLETEPQNFEANKTVGLIYFKRGNIKKSNKYLETAYSVSSNDVDVLCALAKNSTKIGNIKKAKSFLEKANLLKGNTGSIVLPLVKIYSDLGEFGKAAKLMAGYVKVKGTQKNIMLYAELLYKNKEYSESEKYLNEFFKIKSRDKKALMVLARIKRAQSKYRDAMDIYQKISELYPNYSDVFYERAETYAAMGKTMWAEAFYKRTLDKNPKYALAELGLAKIAKQNNKKEEYKKHLKRALDLDPSNKLILIEISSSKVSNN